MYKEQAKHPFLL